MRTRSILIVVLVWIFSATCAQRRTHTTGLVLDLAVAPESCGDVRSIVATAVGGHRAQINVDPGLPIGQIGPRLREIQSYRAEKLTYVTAKADVTWGEFLELVDRVWSESDVVSLITPQVEVLAERRRCLAPSCGRCETLRRTRAR